MKQLPPAPPDSTEHASASKYPSSLEQAPGTVTVPLPCPANKQARGENPVFRRALGCRQDTGCLHRGAGIKASPTSWRKSLSRARTAPHPPPQKTREASRDAQKQNWHLPRSGAQKFPLPGRTSAPPRPLPGEDRQQPGGPAARGLCGDPSAPGTKVRERGAPPRGRPSPSPRPAPPGVPPPALLPRRSRGLPAPDTHGHARQMPAPPTQRPRRRQAASQAGPRSAPALQPPPATHRLGGRAGPPRPPPARAPRSLRRVLPGPAAGAGRGTGGAPGAPAARGPPEDGRALRGLPGLTPAPRSGLGGCPGSASPARPPARPPAGLTPARPARRT